MLRTKILILILCHLFTSPNSSGRSRNWRISQWRAVFENKWSTFQYFERQRGYEASILSMRHLCQEVENSLWTCKNKMIHTSCPLRKKQETELLKNQACWICKFRPKLEEISSSSVKDPEIAEKLKRLLYSS